MKNILSIIIVSWNTKDLVLACIHSIYSKNTDTNPQILVVDNASDDGSADAIAEHFPQVQLIRNTENLGFARANNQAILQARGELILLLNSDTELLSDEPLAEVQQFFAIHPRIGIVGAKLLFPSGRIQSLGRSFLSVKSLVKSQLFFATAPLFDFDRKATSSFLPADYADGAFLAIRRSVVDQIGLLNENYFMYAEDMEWCEKAHEAGWKVAVLPQIEVLHHHAASSKQNYREILVHNAVNNARFLYRRQGAAQARLAFRILLGGMLLRVPVSLLRRSPLFRDYWSGFWSCFRLRKKLSAILRGAPYDPRC